MEGMLGMGTVWCGKAEEVGVPSSSLTRNPFSVAVCKDLLRFLKASVPAMLLDIVAISLIALSKSTWGTILPSLSPVGGRYRRFRTSGEPG